MIVSARPIPSVPWQFTGNHWLALPCIHPADGSIHALGLLHRGARAAVEFAGAPAFEEGRGMPLLRPVLRIDGTVHELAVEGIAWERAVGWLPTFTCAVGSLLLRGTVFAPFGRDADIAGAVYAITVENRGATRHDVELALLGQLGHRQVRVRTPRAFDDAHRVSIAGGDAVVLEGAALPGVASVAIGADGAVRCEAGDGFAETFAVRRTLQVEPGEAVSCAFYLAVGPERDGACATLQVLRRRGWRALLSATREALQQLEQSTGSDAVDRLVNRNLLFAYFYGVGRGIDDAHYYVVRSRAPWHGAGVTVRDWEALIWTLGAVQMADGGLARELLVRTCELHGYAPGQGVHYLDGTLFEPGFSLEGAAAYPLAVDRYIRASNDDQIVEEPVVADTLYVAHDDLAARRDERVPLYATEVNPAGAPVRFPFTLHGNAVVAAALDVLRRTLDEETAREVQEPEAVRAAMHRHFTQDHGGKAQLAAAVDLTGGQDATDDPAGSVLWLPVWEAIDRDDSRFRRTVRARAAADGDLQREIARLLGPDAGTVLGWLRRAPLDQGVAAAHVDADGRAVGDGGDAALAGLLASTVWYAVHALGIQG
jgi:hypothetical protein